MSTCTSSEISSCSTLPILPMCFSTCVVTVSSKSLAIAFLPIGWLSPGRTLGAERLCLHTFGPLFPQVPILLDQRQFLRRQHQRRCAVPARIARILRVTERHRSRLPPMPVDHPQRILGRENIPMPVSLRCI